VWYRTDDGSLEERYDFSDALAIGTYLNIFVRNCDWVRMANWAQLVNAIAPIVTSSRVAVAQPIYYPFALHAQGALDLAVDAHVYGPNIDAKILEGAGRWPHRITDLAPFKVIDAAATVTEDHSRLAVTLVNRARESAELVEIVVRGAELSGEARVRTVTSENSTEVRRLPDVEGVSLEDSELEPRGSLLTLLLPPQSFALVEAERAKT
jgi:alpha-N-arabinofuranosidase